MDGGGVVNLLKPSVLGHAGSMAPELRPPSSAPAANKSADCWSLAYIVHRIITELHPFYFCDNYTHFKYYANWPPTRLSEVCTSEKAKHKFEACREHHLSVLSEVGDIAGLFSRAFGPGQSNPKKRPSASEWEQALGKYVLSMTRTTNSKKVCPACGRENEPGRVFCTKENCWSILYRWLVGCHRCDQLVPVNTSFCFHCGAKQG